MHPMIDVGRVMNELRMMNRDVLSALIEVIDPELGINIVDLGLVCRAAWTESGIAVAITMTAPTCPFGATLVEQAKAALRNRFPDARGIDVDLVWDAPWSPARMTDAGRRRLGWSRPSGNASGEFAIPGTRPATPRREH